jgi:hypothetical protein
MKFENVGGARIVEALTAGIYDGNSNCIREYVQNAVDSKSNLIEIEHLNEGQDIRIRDFGDGMDKEELYNALQFGYSKKSQTEIGWRGIGIYSAVPNFRTIHINTKKKGSNTKYHVTILCDEIRKGYLENSSLEEILEKGVPGEIEEIEDEAFKNGTEVILNNVEISQKKFFQEEALKNELIKVLPLPLAEGSLKSRIKAILEEEKVFEPDFKIKYNGEELNRPPIDYDLFDPESLSCGTLSADDKTKLFVFWALTSKANKELTGLHRGIIFKKKNFTIGDSSTVRRLFDGSYSYWNYGEIHILDPDIRENSARNNFEINSGHAEELFQKVRDLIEDIQRNNRKKSAMDKSKEIEKLKEAISKSDFRSAESMLKKIESSLERKVKGAENQSLVPYSDKLEQKAEEQLKEVKSISTKLSEKKQDKNEQSYREALNALPPGKRKIIEKKIEDPANYTIFTHLMQNVERSLRKKTGSTENEFYKLIKDIFQIEQGCNYEKVKSNAKLFLVDPNLISKGDSKSMGKDYPYRITGEFGHFLNELYQLFVNGEKHHSEVLHEAFTQNMTKIEQLEFYNDILRAIDLSEKIIAASKKRSEIGSLP